MSMIEKLFLNTVDTDDDDERRPSSFLSLSRDGVNSKHARVIVSAAE